MNKVMWPNETHRVIQNKNGHVTQQGKQNWPIGDCAILYTAFSRVRS